MKRRVRGVVKSDKMDKTITVTIERLLKDPRYSKYVRRRSTLKAHDAKDNARVGDLVEIEETRPLSKTKSWRLVRVVRRASELDVMTPEETAAEQEVEQS